MLKSFRENNLQQDISKEIDQIVDSWVSDLLNKMVSTPMDPSTKRSLWDRFKGSLANVWYGGKYNPNNPYYWKHRFGDELGSTTESFDPSVFTLKEYHDLKSAIDIFEKNINEQQLPAGTEKLKLVQTIKSEAEKLKRDLKNIFASATQQPAGASVSTSTSTSASEPLSVGSVPGVGLSSDDASVQKVVQQKRKRGRPRKKSASAQVAPIPPIPPINLSSIKEKEYNVGNEENYKNMLPKEDNKNKSLEELRSSRQYVDAILHPEYDEESFYDPDNDESKKSAAAERIDMLEKLKRDAESNEESKDVLEKINNAILKMKSFI